VIVACRSCRWVPLGEASPASTVLRPRPGSPCCVERARWAAQVLWFLPLHVLSVVSSLRWFRVLAGKAYPRTPPHAPPDVKEAIRCAAVACVGSQIARAPVHVGCLGLWHPQPSVCAGTACLRGRCIGSWTSRFGWAALRPRSPPCSDEVFRTVVILLLFALSGALSFLPLIGTPLSFCTTW
jgi:hypothetical protein